MTVSATVPRVQYTITSSNVTSLASDPASVTFNVTFKYLATSEVVATKTSSGTDTVLTETTHYTLTAAGASGTFTFTATGAALFAADDLLTFNRKMERTSDTFDQLSDYAQNDALDADTLENNFDKAIMISQQMKEAADRRLHFSATSTFETTGEAAAKITATKADRASKYLGFDANGDITTLASITGLTYTETSIAAGHILRYSGSAWVNSNILALDDTKLYFGTDSNISLEYDENGNDTLSFDGGDLLIEDDHKFFFGSNKDVSIEYDEDGDDTLLFQSLTGTALNLGLFSDAGEDNADKWKLSVADGGTITLNSKISGSYVSHLTITPHATVASSSILAPGRLYFSDIGGEYIYGDGSSLYIIAGSSVNFSSGTLSSIDDLNTDAISVDDASVGLNIDFSGGNNTTSKITLKDNVADALNITEGSNSYIKFVTTDSSEQIVFSKDVALDANIGLTFGNAGEKIEGNGTKLDIAASEIDFSIESGGDINIGSDIGLTFGNDGEKIEGNGTKLDIAAAEIDFSIESGGDINIGANIGLTFGDDGEKIEGNGTDLSIASSNKITVSTGTVVDAVNFDSDTLSIDASNNRVGIGTAAPDMPLHVKSADNNLLHLESTDLDALFKLADNGGHFQINTANNNTSLGTNGAAEMMRFSGTSGVVFNEDGNDQEFRIESDTLTHVFHVQGNNGTVSIANSSFNPSADSITLRGPTSGGAVTIGTSGLVWSFFAGSADVRTDASGNLITSSDKNIKKDLGKIKSGKGLSTITQMQAHRYNFLSDLENGIDKPTIGFFAQDLHAINPEIGMKQVKEIDGKEEEIWGINSIGILAYMIEAIKELSAKVTALEGA